MGAMSGVHLSFHVLGPLEVRRGGRVLDLGTPKQRVVLATLLVAGGTPCSVDRLTAQVWDRPPRDPLRSLQVYVSGLRAALADDGTLLRTLDRAYRLEPSEGAVDADRVRVLAGRAGELLRAGGPGDTGRPGAAAALELVEEALGTWRGEAWAGLRHVPVVDAAARRLDRLQRELRTMRGEAMLGLGRHREVLADLEGLVVDHPEDDALLGLLLLALHRSGQRDEALARFRETRARRVAETGLEPGEPVRRLHQQLLVDDPRLAHQPVDLARRRHLPAPVTPLLGRRREVAEVVEAVRGSRLVTVTGPGGVGKTRVALQAAHDLAVDFPDGVWFVPLAAVRDPLLLPQVVAEVLEVDDPREAARAVRAHLARRRLLLLTDNLEQVVDGTPWLGDLLAECPGLRVLATSRVPLRLYGEHLTALDGLDPVDAVRLLHERAAEAGHARVVAGTDPLDLVQSLDLLPLAIELVAARLDEVATGDLGSGLRTRLAAAVDGPRDRTARQQTLRGAIAWSTDLLPARARAVFAGLGVFEGGFETSDALAVTQTDQDTLGLLCRASLVRAPVDGRARMLETVREVALELLDEAADPDAVRDRHAAQVQAVVSAALRDLRAGAGDQTVAATRRLQAEQANCRAALGWLAARVPTRPDCGERLLLLAADLSVHWYRTTPGSEDVSWLERALAAAPDADPALRARAWHGLAICRGEQGRTDEALRAQSPEPALVPVRAATWWGQHARPTPSADCCATSAARRRRCPSWRRAWPCAAG